jgi:YheC/D like ATP-grasp
MKMVGMLHHRTQPHGVKKAFACAAAAKMKGIPFCYFTYSGVNTKDKKINGWMYEEGKWKKKKLNYPGIVINLSNPKTKKQSIVTKELKGHCIFTSHSVGNKMKVYNKLKSKKKYSSYLIPSMPLSGFGEVAASFLSNQKLVIKPFSGNKGKNVYFLERKDNSYIVTEGNSSQTYSQNELEVWIHQLLLENRYLIQPFILCRTRIGLTYDMRIHVQKNGKGEWEINLIYPRISGTGKLVSNVSSGGYRGEWIPFLKEEFGEEWETVRRKLESFATAFPKHFETLYPHSFDELGIDVGIDENLKMWLFEVNWRPGSKHREFEVAKRLIPYCVYLMEKSG